MSSKKTFKKSESAVVSAAKPTSSTTLDTKAKSYDNVLKIFLFVVAFGLYANTLGHQYAFDDSLVITENSFTKAGFAGIGDLLTKDFFIGHYGEQGMELTGGRYRPLSLLTFAVEYQFFGLNPFVSHFINVLLFALTAVLMFNLLRKWFGQDTAIPFVATLFFVVHPIHTEVVANIKSRDEILSFILLLSAFYSLWKIYEGANKTRWTILGSVAYFLAMMSKETAFMFLPVIPLSMYVLKNETLAESIKKALPYIAVAVFYFVLRASLVGMVGSETNKDIMENPFVNSSFVEKYATIGVILLKYFSLLVVPSPLSCDYSFNQIPFTNFSDSIALTGWALYALLGGYAAWKIWKRDIPAFCAVLYLLPLFITSNIPFNIGAPMGERFLYFPSFGFVLFLAYATEKWLKIDSFQTLLKKPAVLGSIALLSLVFSVMTVQRNPHWYDTVTLFKEDVNHAPNSAKINYYYANSLLNEYIAKPIPANQPLLKEAITHLEKSVAINPVFHHATYCMANTYDQMGNGQKSLEWLEKTLVLAPTHIKATYLMGQVQGKYFNNADKAVEYMEKYVNTYHQRDSYGLSSLGTAYAMKGRLPEAQKLLEEAIRIDANNPDAWFNLGIVLSQQGQTDKGKQYMDKGRALREAR